MLTASIPEHHAALPHHHQVKGSWLRYSRALSHKMKTMLIEYVEKQELLTLQHSSHALLLFLQMPDGAGNTKTTSLVITNGDYCDSGAHTHL